MRCFFELSIDMTKEVLKVAVAVICYQELFLVARRPSHKQQGGLLEFVGGKVESAESPKSALVRELKEELDLDAMPQALVSMGEIFHEYDDVCVELWVFCVHLTKQMYDNCKNKACGAECQPIFWYTKDELMQKIAQFPKANQAIFEWI